MEIVATPATTDPKRLHGTWTYPSSGTVNSQGARRASKLSVFRAHPETSTLLPSPGTGA